jgi:hypothetical protein
VTPVPVVALCCTTAPRTEFTFWASWSEALEADRELYPCDDGGCLGLHLLVGLDASGRIRVVRPPPRTATTTREETLMNQPDPQPTPDEMRPLILVSRMAAALIRGDGDQTLLIDHEIGSNPAYWRTVAMAAIAEFATEVVEHRGDKAHAWLLHRIDHDLGPQ